MLSALFRLFITVKDTRSVVMTGKNVCSVTIHSQAMMYWMHLLVIRLLYSTNSPVLIFRAGTVIFVKLEAKAVHTPRPICTVRETRI